MGALKISKAVELGRYILKDPYCLSGPMLSSFNLYQKTHVLELFCLLNKQKWYDIFCLDLP